MLAHRARTIRRTAGIGWRNRGVIQCGAGNVLARRLDRQRNADRHGRRHGASPAQTGSAVLAALVDFNGVAGAFYRLHELEEGTRVVVVLDDGTRQV